MNKEKNLIVRTLKTIFFFLPNEYKKKFILLNVGGLINSFFDLLGLASLIPLLVLLLKEDFLNEPSLLLDLYNYLEFSDERWFAVFLSGFVLLIIIAKNIFGFFIQASQMNFSGTVYQFLSSSMYSSIYSKGLSFFRSENSNQIQNRVVRIPQIVSQTVNIGLFQFINESIILILVIISITIYDPKIVLILSVTIVPIFIVFYKLNASKINDVSKKINEYAPLIQQPVYELAFGFIDVAVTGVFNRFKERFSKQVGGMKNEQVTLLKLNSIPNRLVDVSVVSTVILILMYGIFIVKDKQQIITLVSVFGLSAYKLVPSVNRLIIAFLNIKSAEYTLDVLEKYLEKGKAVISSEKVDFEKVISFKSMSFKYEDTGKNIFENIDFDIEKRDCIGVVGESGAGKSTLVNLLLGFYFPTEGSIYVDDTKLSKKTRDSWLKIVGYVRQDLFILDGTVCENIAFGVGEENVDHARLKQSIEMACLTDFVKALPNGINSLIGELGGKISGGQRQRIGIARALYHGAEVLLFDEATSALDEKTEIEITESIKLLKELGVTIVIISHRNSSLAYCNKIINVSNGKITTA